MASGLISTTLTPVEVPSNSASTWREGLLSGGLFATICEKIGDPLKKESFTSRAHQVAKRLPWTSYTSHGLLRKLLSAASLSFKGKRRDSAELRRSSTSCFLLLPWMQNSVETQETEQAQETDLHSSSVPTSSASCPWLQETELRTENSFPPCPMDPPPSHDPRTDACCRPHCAGLPPGLLHANNTNSARPGTAHSQILTIKTARNGLWPPLYTKTSN